MMESNEKLIKKSREDTEAALNKQYEALVTKVMSIAQNQNAELASNIVRTIQSKLTTIFEPIKTEVARITAYISGLTQQRRQLLKKKRRYKSRNPLTVICVFCNKNTHFSTDCRTVLTPLGRYAVAKAKGTCTKFLSKFKDDGSGRTPVSTTDTDTPAPPTYPEDVAVPAAPESSPPPPPMFIRHPDGTEEDNPEAYIRRGYGWDGAHRQQLAGRLARGRIMTLSRILRS